MNRRIAVCIAVISFGLMACCCGGVPAVPVQPIRPQAKVVIEDKTFPPIVETQPKSPQPPIEKPKPKPVSKSPGIVIGTWADPADLSGSSSDGTIAIFQRDGKNFMRRYYPDGKYWGKEVMEESHKGMRKFSASKNGKSISSDYYLIDASGNLQSWDRDGLIHTRKTVKGFVFPPDDK